MSNLYYSLPKINKIKRLNYFSPNTWREVHLICTNQVYHTREKRIYGRNTNIPPNFVNYEVLIYSGKKWHSRRVSKWMIGFKAGEFTWNRRYALFKAKQARKKKSLKK